MVSELEKQRLVNIARNKELLRKLSLDSISNKIKKEAEEEAEAEIKKKATRKKRSREATPTAPLRKSRRLQGIKIEETEDYGKAFAKTEKERIENEKFEELKAMKLPGNVSLLDVLKENSKSSDINLKFEDDDGKDEDDSVALLKNFMHLANNFSVGDFYETISKKPTNDKSVDKLRKDFSKLKIYQKFKPNDIQLTADRLTMIQFYPSIKEKIIVGGDTLGNLGIWNPGSDTDKNPAISLFSLHGKTICKIVFEPKSPNHIFTASYDNSIRCTDLKTLKSTEVMGLLDDNGNDIGISDIQISTNTTSNYNNLIFFTTLNGQFGSFDIRTRPASNDIQLYRLSDKKIGGFSINPRANYQISTASLDRTLKIWDLRKIHSKSTWSEKFEEEECLHSYGSFTSRLSVSISDWNSSGDIVCNGYSDTINILNLGDTSSWKSTHLYKPKKKSKEIIPNTLKPNHVLKHNCRTGKWVSILKARWQINPRDGYEKFVIGNMKKALDIYTASGIQVAHLQDPNVTAVPAVATFHPTENWVVGGTARGKCVLFQ